MKARLGRAAITLVAFLSLMIPYLILGYSQDDGLNSAFPGYLANHGVTLPRLLVQLEHDWLFSNGRLFPLGILLSYGWWGLHAPLWLYRSIHVGMVGACLVLWVSFLKRCGVSRGFADLSALCALVCFQLRDYHDPIGGYAFLMQWIILLGLGSSVLYQSFRVHREAWRLAASLVLFTLALLAYETSLAFLPILLLLTREDMPDRTRPPWIARWGYGLIAAAYLITVAWLRTHTPLEYLGTRTALGLPAVRTLVSQATGVLPMVYAIFGRSGIYSVSALTSAEFWSPIWLLFGSGLAVGALAFRMLDPSDVVTEVPRRLRWIAVLLWLAPCLFVAVSVKYQDEVRRPGMAYLPVFLSYFGFSIFLASGLRWLARRRSVRFAAALLACLSVLGLAANLAAARKINAIDKDGRVLVERAFESGLLAGLAEGTTLVVDIEGGWFNADFMRCYAARALPFVNLRRGQPAPAAGPKVRWLQIDVEGQVARLMESRASASDSVSTDKVGRPTP